MPSRWSPAPASDLPDGLILFDGVCVLCSRWVQFVIARDKEERFRFVAIQTPLGQALAKRLGIDPAEPETNVVIDGGTAYFKMDSALAAVVHFRNWGWTRIAWLAPRPIRNFFYDRVARNRYRIFGRTDSCMVPAPHIKQRFLSSATELVHETRA